MVVLWPEWRVELQDQGYYQQGRMTGGGTCIQDGLRVTYGFELHCHSDALPNNLQISFGGNLFHLESLESAACFNDPSIVPSPAPFNTYVGFGTGRVNEDTDCTVDFIFTDAGEPGTADTVEISISCPSGASLEIEECPLTGGNHKAHLQQ
jgi:hypothetical protein